MIIYMHISIVAIRLATERETGIVRVMDRICSEVMRGSLEGSGRVDGNLRNISEGSVMNRREGVEVCEESGHLVLGGSICSSLFVALLCKVLVLPFISSTTTLSNSRDVGHLGR